MFSVTALAPVGARVEGLRVGALDPAAVDRMRAVLAGHGVAILPGQQVGDAEFLDFLASFGDLTFTVGETPVPGFGDLNVISNVGRTTPPRSTFHVDTSYVRRPPAYTALRAVEIPRRGGHTLFTNQYRAWDTLPPHLRGDLHGRNITHVVTGLDLDDDAETSATHPVALVHPVSGRTALYISTPKRCAAVSGIPPARAAEIVEMLVTHSTRADNVLRHRWSPGDIVMWDNRCVLHRADHDGVDGDRIMHRGTVDDRAAG